MPKITATLTTQTDAPRRIESTIERSAGTRVGFVVATARTLVSSSITHDGVVTILVERDGVRIRTETVLDAERPLRVAAAK